MTHVTCRLTAISSGTLRSVIKYGLPLPLTCNSYYCLGLFKNVYDDDDDIHLPLALLYFSNFNHSILLAYSG